MANTSLALTGRRFGLVTVGGRVGSVGGKSTWACRCDCGNSFVTKGVYLNKGVTRSCGCIRGGNHRTHGKSHSSEYRSWSAMRTRCLNANHHLYHRYGGRHIVICKRWEKFEHFLADMGPRPEGCSLERINNDGGYSPRNCKWATPREQARNTMRNATFKWKGKEYCLKELSEFSGIKRTTLRQRLAYGWPVNAAVTTAVSKKGGRS